jgi:hypothetical protein
VPSSPQVITTRGVFDYLIDLAGKPIVGATVNCILNFNGASVTSPIVNLGEKQQSTTTDQNGFWRLLLTPNDTITPTGTLYTIQSPASSYDISVPSGGADIQSSSILANTPSVLSPALTGLTGPITVTGNETVTGNLSVSGTTTLGSTTAGATTLGATTVGGDLTIGSAFRLLFGATVAKIVPGATSISHRNNADSADNLLISDAGVVTTRNDIVISAGRLLVSATAAKILGGVTSLSLRNNVDSADNVLVTDAGNVTIRGTSTAVTNAYKARAKNTSSTAMSTGVTKIALQSKDYDPNSNFDAVTNFNYTAPVAGYYLIIAKFLFSSVVGTGQEVLGFIFKNAVLLDKATESIGTVATTPAFTLAGVYLLAANDTIDIRGQASSGTPTTWVDANNFCALSVHWVSS